MVVNACNPKYFTLNILPSKNISHTTYVQHVILLLEFFFKEFVVQIANTYIHYTYNMTRHLRIYNACILCMCVRNYIQTDNIIDQNVKFFALRKSFVSPYCTNVQCTYNLYVCNLFHILSFSAMNMHSRMYTIKYIKKKIYSLLLYTCSYAHI